MTLWEGVRPHQQKGDFSQYGRRGKRKVFLELIPLKQSS
jgi:hypothetical protein